MQPIVFKPEGYDPFIDYLKGVCILWVVMTHAINPAVHDSSLFCLWGDMAVPLFLLIQCIHAYKRTGGPTPLSWDKIWHRILKPFLYVQLLIIIIGVTLSFILGHSCKDFLFDVARLGGYGRGSYYPKMYLEFAVLIVVMFPVFRRNTWMGGGILLSVSIIVEFLFSYYNLYVVWQWICFRYLMLIWLGWMVARQGVKLNKATVILSLTSILAILVFQYSS